MLHFWFQGLFWFQGRPAFICFKDVHQAKCTSRVNIPVPAPHGLMLLFWIHSNSHYTMMQPWWMD